MSTTGFERPTLAELREEGRADVASRLGFSALLPRSVLAVLADLCSGQAHGLHGHLEWLSRQQLPDTADTTYLDRWASIYGVSRKIGTAATGSVTFTGTDDVVIPAGTLIRRTLDGAEYATDSAVTIAASTATAEVTAQATGAESDADTGQELTLSTPITGVDSIATVDSPGLTGGAGRETDAELLSRLLLRIQTPPQGGSAADYEAWALEVAGVTRAWGLEQHLGPGTVGVAFAVDNDPDGPIPDAAQVAAVQAYIDARRPVTATVTVFAPTPVELSPDITLTPDTGTVRTNVEASLEEYLRRNAEPGGTTYLSQVREAISVAAGETNHVLESLKGGTVDPPADITVAAGELMLLGTITWS